MIIKISPVAGFRSQGCGLTIDGEAFPTLDQLPSRLASESSLNDQVRQVIILREAATRHTQISLSRS